MDDRDALTLRLRAADLFAEGWSQARVARALGVTRTTAMRWQRLWRLEGRAGLARGGRRGRPRTAGGGELTRALAGIPGEWSVDRIARELAVRAGVRYHPGHLWRVLKRRGWRGPGAPRSDAELRDPDGHVIVLARAPGAARPAPPGPEPPPSS
jgi:transposase